MAWYTIRMGIRLPEGLDESKMDLLLYRYTKNSDLEFDVEEILSVDNEDVDHEI